MNRHRITRTPDYAQRFTNMSEEITGHPAIDDWLKCYKPQLSKKDYAKFCSMLSALKSDEQQLRHKLRELILGGFLAKRGFTVEYEREHYGQTPEWTIFKDSKMIAIAEVRNFHGDIKIENEIRKGGAEGLTMASGYRVAFGENVFVFAYLPSCREKKGLGPSTREVRKVQTIS